MEQQPPDSRDDEPGGLTSGDPLGDSPADEPALGPFTGGSSAPFGSAMQDDQAAPAPPPAFPEPVAPEPEPEPEPAAEPAAAGPGGWVPEDAPVADGPAQAPPPPPPAFPEPTPAPGGLAAGDPLGAPAPPVSAGGLSVPPPGYAPPPGPYGGGPVPPGAFAAPEPGAKPLGNYELAGWLARGGALIVDSIIVSLVSVVTLFVFGAVFGGIGSLGGDGGGGIGFGIGALISFIPILIISLGYQPFWMARTNGQTIGKQVAGIRVIRTNGQETDLGWSALRQIVVIGLLFGVGGGFFFSLPTLLNYLWPLWDEENRALHDMLVSSRVVKA